MLKRIRRVARRFLDGVVVRWRALKDGLWPYPVFYLRRYWRTRHPVTYKEKLHYKMIRDRRPLLRTFADKVAVRDYVTQRVGPGFLTNLYTVASDARDIDWAAIPRQYVCKPAHLWGRVVIVREGADASTPVAAWADQGGPGYYIFHPDHVDLPQITAILSAWQREHHGWGPGSKWEWCYRGIPPRILVEELLEGPDGHLVDDIKCYVFNGRCRTMRYITRWREGRLIPPEAALLSPTWNILPGTFKEGGHVLQRVPPAPDCLNEIVRCAERLGQDTDFVRVDMYVIGQRLVVGELTNYPSAGSATITRSLDQQMGHLWTVPRRYRDPEIRLAAGTTSQPGAA